MPTTNNKEAYANKYNKQRGCQGWKSCLANR